MKKTLVFFFVLFTLFSCASADKKAPDFSGVGQPVDRDYIDFLTSVGEVYLKSDGREIKLYPESIAYLNSIFAQLKNNNESLLDGKRERAQFHIINQSMPFIFSLPQDQFFISRGLMEKYLKSEELFVAALSAEVLRSERFIYEKKLLLPLGFYTTEKMIQLTRIDAVAKSKINEWCYYILKRAGFDASAYLNWIQVQNRNTLDFSMYLGDVYDVSREEHNFKNFMTKQGIASVEKKINEANSSKEFYKLIKNITGSR